jgi:Fe-S cluster assembly iron-binding protein IscA
LGLALDEPGEDDSTLHLNGIEILAEKKLLPYLEGQLIDFINSRYETGFSISPEHGSSCA